MSEQIKACVIGHPIGHSKSPLIHNYWIKKYGLSGTYDAVDIPCENLEQGIKDLDAQNYSGFNVTIPHKEDIAELCDEVDDLARSVGAVNTVSIKESKLYGTNTDVFGFTENLKENAPGLNFAAGKSVIFGAGGAAKAIVHGLLQEGTPDILIVNRTREKAEKLVENCADPSRINIGSWDQRHEALRDANLLVNTTALGMEGQNALEIDLQELPPHAVVHDIVYTPLYTELLKTAQARGNPVVTGIGMLIHQARPAFEQWFGIMPDVDEELEKMVLG